MVDPSAYPEAPREPQRTLCQSEQRLTVVCRFRQGEQKERDPVYAWWSSEQRLLGTTGKNPYLRALVAEAFTD